MLSTDKQTNKQTNRQTNATKNITSFAKEVTRSTQRAQTSLAEADHCSHILPTVKMLSLGCERLTPLNKKKKKKEEGSGSLPAPRSGYATTIIVFFLLIYSSYNTQITTKI